ncbi:MAG: DivIVA domain-containing protein [Actinobacteria bacterium]|nr:DivIVA domain-containing protein [Actinomycetota bacterium]HRW02008.1 DivIVA domain-containing protein [Tetrasphaera sp.]
MIWVFFTVVAVLLVAAFAGLIARRATYDSLPEPVHTAHDVQAARIERAGDIDNIHFDTALRGYRMDQVDAVLETLRTKLLAYEAGDRPTTRLSRVSPRVTPPSAERSRIPTPPPGE